MITTITKSWKFRTIRIKGTSKCSKCGKPITKYFSMELREDVPTTNEHIKELEEEKEQWLKESHVCIKCKKEKIKQQRKDITHAYDFTFNTLREKQAWIDKYVVDKKEHIDFLNRELKNKVILYNNEEYVISYIQDGRYEDMDFEIVADSISKKEPWLKSSKQVIFYQGIKPSGWNNFVPLFRCIITDEDFSKRKELLCD